MVRAECLLYELNRLSGGRIHLLEFLGDLNASTGVTDNSFIDPKTIGIELVPVLRDSGHFVSCVISHERELTVYFSRRIGTEFEKNKNSSHMIVEQITYRPTPSRRLNKARRHEWNHFNLSHALWEDLKAMNLEDATAFFTPQGEQQLLSFFKWTKLSLMTNPEARKARVAYLQEKHTPDDSAMEIAQSLKNAELYSRNTSLSQIKKYLPKLLSEAFPSDL